MLRPARADDDSFLSALYDDVRADERPGSGMTPEQWAALMAMQRRARDAHYARHFEGAGHDIVELGGEPIGRLLVHRGPGRWHLVDIEILSRHRGAGIGTTLLRRLQAEAARAGCPLNLHVVDMNPAMRLYQRLGFERVRLEGLHVLMEWRAHGPPSRAKPEE